jgi:hypothetical protein
MRGRVDEGLKRAAPKKPFSDPRSSIMDDPNVHDYGKDNPIAPGVLAPLQQARSTLLGP